MARAVIKLLYVECMEDDNTLNEENYVRHAWTEAELWCQRVVGLLRPGWRSPGYGGLVQYWLLYHCQRG